MEDQKKTQYELMLVMDPEQDEKKELETVRGLLKGYEITVEEEDVWGLRTLAYPINKMSQGRYVLMFIETTDLSRLADLKKELNINGAVLRYTLVKTRG